MKGSLVQKPKQEEKGDGLALHNAIKTSSKTPDDIAQAMGIGRSTLFSYYKYETLAESVKRSAAKALGGDFDKIFGQKSDNLIRVFDAKKQGVKKSDVEGTSFSQPQAAQTLAQFTLLDQAALELMKSVIALPSQALIRVDSTDLVAYQATPKQKARYVYAHAAEMIKEREQWVRMA